MTATFATIAEAADFAATVLVTSGGKTHLPTFGADRHADDCTSTVRPALCGCAKRYTITAAESACGSLSQVSKVHAGRYATHAGGFTPRGGALPTCSKCAKYAKNVG
jgi:hypothetical protein